MSFENSQVPTVLTFGGAKITKLEQIVEHTKLHSDEFQPTHDTRPKSFPQAELTNHLVHAIKTNKKQKDHKKYIQFSKLYMQNLLSLSTICNIITWAKNPRTQRK